MYTHRMNEESIMVRYLYLVEYTVTYESGRTVPKTYQIVASSKYNALVKIGQMHNDINEDKEIAVISIKLIG